MSEHVIHIMNIIKALEEIEKQLPKPDRRGFHIVNRPATIALPGEFQCVAQVRCLGQKEAKESNDLIAGGIIWLPCDPNNYLPCQLRFDSHLMLAGEPTELDWGVCANCTSWPCVGESSNGNAWRRSNFIVGIGPTWIKALNEAEKLTISNIAKLWATLVIRQESLQSDGEEYFLAKSLLP